MGRRVTEICIPQPLCLFETLMLVSVSCSMINYK